MKKVISVVLVAIMLFSFTSIAVSAEETSPALSYTEEVQVVIPATHRLTNEDGSGFGVDVAINTKNVIALDGFTTEHAYEVISIKAQKDGASRVTYDENYSDETVPDPFFEYFTFPEGEDRKAISLYVTLKIDFTYAEVFGDLGYEVSVSGFSAPPDLGGDLGGLLGGATDSLPIPTTVTQAGKIEEFPAIGSLDIKNASKKQVYLDSELPEVEGTSLEVNTVTHTYNSDGDILSTTDVATGTITYAPANAHMFTTIPERTERVPVGTTEIVTYFSGIKLSTLPITVSHDWSTGPVSITTDKYTTNKPGYHAIVCNGCGEAHSAAEHTVDHDTWVSNEDATFVGNGTASTVCLDCGATLTKDVQGSAQFNTAFANYHFLLVIFEYINFILRIIGTSVG